MNLQATLDRVIIRPDAENTSSVLIIPEKAKRFHDRGTVVAVGPGRRHMDGKIYEPRIKVGDRVLFSKLHVFPFDLDGEKLMVMEGEEILAVLKPEVECVSCVESPGSAASN